MWVSSAHRCPANGFSQAYVPESAVWGITRLEDLVQQRRSTFHIRLACDPVAEDYPVADDYLVLMGAYVSEGCVRKRSKDGAASVLGVSQKSGGRLEPLMEDWRRSHPDVTRRFEYLHTEEWRNVPCLEITWTVADRALVSRMEQECGSGSHFKHLPSWTQQLSQRQVLLLLSSLVAGDGSGRKFSSLYHTCSKRLADDIQAMCVAAGIVTQVWGPYQSEEDSTPMYQVYLGQGDPFAFVVLRGEGSQNFTLEEVTETRIVCFTVPNEILVTRRCGKVAIQGNTKHGMHLVRLMRMCREILTEGVVHVRREDADELCAIREGAWDYDKLVGWAEDQDIELIEVANKSPLPKAPDRRSLDQLCQEIVRSMQEN